MTMILFSKQDSFPKKINFWENNIIVIINISTSAKKISFWKNNITVIIDLSTSADIVRLNIEDPAQVEEVEIFHRRIFCSFILKVLLYHKRKGKQHLGPRTIQFLGTISVSARRMDSSA